jgi:ribosomal protein S18 acetylase RimI-like enzyme
MSTSTRKDAIRPLDVGDMTSVITLDRQLSGRSREGYFEKRFQAFQADPDAFVYLGCFGSNGLDGYLLVHMLEGEFGTPEPVAVMDSLGVKPEMQHQGIGPALLDELQSRLKSKNVSLLRTQAEWRHRDILNFLSTSGFDLAERYIYERDVAPIDSIAREQGFDTQHASSSFGDNLYTIQSTIASQPSDPDYPVLERDAIPCRSMKADDLAALIKIDRKLVGRERRAYYERKTKETLEESGVRVSLVAEDDGFVVGFIMARVDFGEFGQTEPEAVIDTIGVDPDFAGKGIGGALISQLMNNLTALRADRVRSETQYNELALQQFLQHNGFRPAQRLSFSRQVI